MIYKEFNNIEIFDGLGVSPVGEDTRIIARYASKLKFKKALEIGAGTGFISIFLKKIGKDCQGTDINPKAIECAKDNALRNGVLVNFYNSDLFENVKNNFDLIIFNPPYGNIRSKWASKKLEFLKSFLPKDTKLSKFLFKLTKKSRGNLIKEFLKESINFINKPGKILLFMNVLELDLVKGYDYKICKEYKEMRLIEINLSHKNKIFKEERK